MAVVESRAGLMGSAGGCLGAFEGVSIGGTSSLISQLHCCTLSELVGGFSTQLTYPEEFSQC